jgi:hypothetical protein
MPQAGPGVPCSRRRTGRTVARVSAPFLPGLRLCGQFHAEAVGPLLTRAVPGLVYAAARIGPGSDVLGLDTMRSTDHDWGPRLEVFLDPADLARHGADLAEMLSRRLPTVFRGWSTHFVPPAARVREPAATDGPVAHLVRFTDLGSWCDTQLGFDPRSGVRLLDWLATPGQRFAETIGGAVYHDGPGELSAVRRRLRWYPDDVWRHVLAAQWTRIAQEESFVGRPAEVGDELGSRVLTARLAREVLRLCLLLGRRWALYGKWLGTAVATLPAATGIVAALRLAVRADAAADRQAALCAAYEAAGAWQNRSALAAPVDTTRRTFHDRPYPVIGADRFAAALRAAVVALPPLGAVDQLVDDTDVLTVPARCRAATAALLQPNRTTA